MSLRDRLRTQELHDLANIHLEDRDHGRPNGEFKYPNRRSARRVWPEA